MDVWGWGVCCSVAWSYRGGPAAAAAVVLGVNEKLLGSKRKRQRQRGELLWAMEKRTVGEEEKKREGGEMLGGGEVRQR